MINASAAISTRSHVHALVAAPCQPAPHFLPLALRFRSGSKKSSRTGRWQPAPFQFVTACCLPPPAAANPTSERRLTPSTQAWSRIPSCSLGGACLRAHMGRYTLLLPQSPKRLAMKCPYVPDAPVRPNSTVARGGVQQQEGITPRG